MNTRTPIVCRSVSLVILVLLLSCTPNRKLAEAGMNEDNEFHTTEESTFVSSFNLSIKCLDLSENNALATKNDELLILLYAAADQVSRPAFAKMQTAEAGFEKSWELMLPILPDSAYFLVLIEMDSEKTISQIEPVIRLNQLALNEAYSNRDKKSIRALLGDDDLLGLYFIKQGENLINFQGVHLFDTYHYRLNLIPK